ncbi:MAG: efflux RND transporter periplasmic adaptor subunit [Rhodospirillales bacterium]|nr:efflux RND transporter periplasmic adaptor subunit [Rhodospirillales bacterium]MDH3914005.1 efflux RND transporter periplasmic adaptor subunit [Rhodospirillales bacterium]MDH3919209.1 efflux RND transporter periplasmic adaptor subunit [Rhodospirillales bacterium]MDH3968864.1 efflux RND transporter periplasmic adaptor subunit [Rhodospirillales bacterium]
MQPSRLFAGLAIVAGLTGLLPGGPRAQEFTVEVRPVDDLKAVFAAVASLDTTPARTRIGGTISGLAVDEGSPVEEGELLARVEDPKLALEVAALDARIESAKAEVKLAGIERDRFKTLRGRGTVSQAALDSAETASSVATGTLAALRVERALVVERQAEGDVLAPKPGRVLEVPVTDGQVVLPGETVAVIAAQAYVLRLHLPERHARFLKEGDPVLVGARGLAVDDKGMREGRVRQVYPELDRGRVVADVTVEGLGDYFVGERTRVYVATGKRPAIVVPADYLFTRSGVTYARLADVGDTVVQPGLPAPGGIEILSGLRPGDVLVKPAEPETGS